MIINGVISSNCGAASANIRAQKIHFNGLKNIDKLHDGTINLDISPGQFQIIKSLHKFSSINWGRMTEDFELIPIEKIAYRSNLTSVSGYLYLPSESLNRKGGKILEIWTEFIEDIVKGEQIEIAIPNGYLKVS